MAERNEKTLKVLEPIQLDVKTFKDKQEFELFFNSHKNEFENSTTTRLNRMYKIPGYRISRVKDELCLKKDYTKNNLGPVPEIRGRLRAGLADFQFLSLARTGQIVGFAGQRYAGSDVFGRFRVYRSGNRLPFPV